MTKCSKIPYISFAEFLAIWNAVQKIPSTPDIHFRMADWLENALGAKKREILLQAFRGSGKSTICGVFIAWLLLRDPCMRILVLAAEENLASRMVDNVRRIIEKHPLTFHLKPKKANAWASGRFTVVRDQELREPSLLARGINSNITGMRADVVICDDVEVPTTCETAGAREMLRKRLTEIEFILTPLGAQLYLGTPHTYDTIYNDFLKGFHRLQIPIMDNDGKSAWPARFSSKTIDEMLRRSGPVAFGSQMLLDPMALSTGRLDSELLQEYCDEITFDKAYNLVKLGTHEITHVSAWWDPSYGAHGGDSSVLAIVLRTRDGHMFLHDALYIKQNAAQQNDNSAQEQCESIAHAIKLYRLPSITIETNGIGKFLPEVLRKTLVQHKLRCQVRPAVSTRPKVVRILEAFDAPLASGMFWAHKKRVLENHKFMNEIRSWSPNDGNQNPKDDGLDAFAGAISQPFSRLSASGSVRGF